MRDLYPRLFEPPFIEPDLPNPRHLEEAEYRALAVEAAIGGARRNGVEIRAGDVTFPGSDFAPTRVTVRVRGEARVSLGGVGRGPGGKRAGRMRRRAKVPVGARATAELRPGSAGGALPGMAGGGGYSGPLA